MIYDERAIMELLDSEPVDDQQEENSTGSIEIRDTVEKDLEQLDWLYRQNYYGESNEYTDYSGAVSKFQELSRNTDYKFASAVDGETLVGFGCAIANHFIVEEQRPAVMIWDLRVSPNCRKGGVGSRLLSYLEDWARSIGAELVGLACDGGNITGQKFYKKNKYQSGCKFFLKPL